MPNVKLLDLTEGRRRLDRYELIGEIASGGMATVFLSRLAGVGGFQRFVAIKRLHPHLAGEQEFVEMFLDEARLAAGIHHQHVVPILEVGMSGGFYLVMEYIEGDTLARLVARAISGGGSVPRPVLLRVLLDALAGLHAAHNVTDANGQMVHLVHRDCSPQNILVGMDGCTRLTDFGVARASSRLSTTRADKLKGKLAYMSPEQARGNDLDLRADLFSMGVILWEILAGRRLFKSESEAGTLSRILMDPIPTLRGVAPEMHPAIDSVVAKSLERNPDDRFQSAAEMADALERAARESAEKNEAGVASPREVAAYLQQVIGAEIAAQREAVRAWLAVGENGLPPLKPQVPLRTLVSRSEPAPPADKKVHIDVIDGATTALRVDNGAVRKDVTVKIPLERKAPSDKSNGAARISQPPSVVVSLPTVSPPPRRDGPSSPPPLSPPSSHTMVGIGPDPTPPPGLPPVEPVPYSRDEDEIATVKGDDTDLNDVSDALDNEQDTLMMVRSNTKMTSSLSLPISMLADGRQNASEPPTLMMMPTRSDPPPPAKKRIGTTAILFGLSAIIGAFVIYRLLSQSTSNAGPIETTVQMTSPAQTAAVVTPPPSNVATVAPPTPAPTATQAPTPSASADTSSKKHSVASTPPRPPPDKPAPPPEKPAPPPDKPAPPPEKPPPPKPPPSDDLQNPYR